MADDLSARAHTRPGYATYADTPAGDPTSPHRPPRPGRATYPNRRQAEAPSAGQVPPVVQAPSTWWVSADQVAEFVERAGIRLEPWQRHMLDRVYAAPPPIVAFDGALTADELAEIRARYLARRGEPPIVLADDEVELVASRERDAKAARWWRRALRRITRRS